MTSPLVTVITPYYNNAATLKQALDSVFSQSYDRIQHILIDDGSSDFCIQDIRDYISSKKKTNLEESLILQTGKNVGTVKAWNLAIPHIKGEYVFSLAADDAFFDDDVLSDWVHEFLQTNALALAAKRAVYDPSLQKIRYLAPSNSEIEAIQTCTNQQLLDRLSGGNFIFGCCTAYQKKCYEIIGGKMDERYRLVEDYPMVLKLLRADISFHFFDRVVLKYRLGGVSNAGNINKKYLKEANALFRNECYPYVTDQKTAKKQYKKWRNRIVIAHHRKVFRKRFHSDEKKGGLFLYRIFMIVLHPVYMFRKYKKKTNAKKNAHR